jgi:cytidylate kinase
MAIITISGSIESNRASLANKLAQELSYKAVFPEVISECSRKYNILKNELLNELDKYPNLLRRLTGKNKSHLIFIQCSLLDAVKKDNIIYYGHFGQLFLAGLSNVLKIKINEPFYSVVDSYMKETGKSREEASDHILELEKHRNKLIKMLFHEDRQNPSLYDIIINLDQISDNDIINIVKSAIINRFETTEISKKQLQKLSLECEVKAAIASDFNLLNEDITVSAQGSTILLKGLIKSEKTKKQIIDTIYQVKGVENCECFAAVQSEPLKRDLHSHYHDSKLESHH